MHRIIAFVLAEGRVERGHAEVIHAPSQSMPSSMPAAIPRQLLMKKEGGVVLKAYPPNVLVAEITREIEDMFSDEAFAMRARMVKECRDMLERQHAKLAVSEEYAIAVIDGYKGPAEQFLDRAPAIARFLKSEPLPLHAAEIAHTITHGQMTYGKDDLVIVDWDGAFVFQQNGQVDSTIEVLQLANLHLLQYRMLDGDLDHRLQRIEQLIRTRAVSHIVFWNRELARTYKEVISMRSNSIVQFDAIIREIKLIGEWYAARLYEITAKKFRLEGWRQSAKEKLETLEDAYGIVSQNFRISKEHFFELMLQAGWLALILLELYSIALS